MRSFFFFFCLLIAARAEQSTSGNDTSTESCANYISKSADDEYIDSVTCNQTLISGTSSYRIQLSLNLKQKVFGWYLTIKFSTDKKKMNVTTVNGAQLMTLEEFGPNTFVFLNEMADTLTVNLSLTVRLIASQDASKLKVPKKDNASPKKDSASPKKHSPPATPVKPKRGPTRQQQENSRHSWWPAEVEVTCVHCSTLQVVPNKAITNMCNGSVIGKPKLRSLPPPPDKIKDSVYSIKIKLPILKPPPHKKSSSNEEEEQLVTCRLHLQLNARLISVEQGIQIERKSRFSQTQLVAKDISQRGDMVITLQYASNATQNSANKRRKAKPEEIRVECRRCNSDITTEPPTSSPMFVLGGETTTQVLTIPSETTPPPDCNEFSNCNEQSTNTAASPTERNNASLTTDTEKPPETNDPDINIARTGDEESNKDNDAPDGLWIGVGIVGAVVLVGGAAAGVKVYRSMNHSAYSPNSDKTNQPPPEPPETYTPMQEVRAQDTAPVYEQPSPAADESHV
ncbi:uncharacterized protein LOC134191867 isoform X1 [Corticium candelabrum]|uniref:uncharacterized protein LOC134191867 isoform X1 n=1 Tax=Corticium candelabrum TaxID=121492 RepID=UPI002E26995C|nr:uncharacterized protein LOC134191867 isoform X1 [Corticium candelabrum]